MSDILYQVGIQITAYLTVIILTFLGMNWVTNGFTFTSLRVKLSRGRFILVSVRNVAGSYYRVGKMSFGFLSYKDLDKMTHRITIDDSTFIDHIGGTKSIIVDEKTDKVCKPNLEGGTGFDGVKFENLYIRALMAPELQDKIIKIILIAAIIAAGAGVLGLILIYRQGVVLTELLRLAKVAAGATI